MVPRRPERPASSRTTANGRARRRARSRWQRPGRTRRAAGPDSGLFLAHPIPEPFPVSLHFTTAGESHGKALVAIVEGLPAGLPISAEAVDRDLARRMMGYGRGARMKIERDRVEWLSGVRAGETLGSPVAMLIPNRDWKNWEDVMAAEGVPGELRRRRVSRPRQGTPTWSVSSSTIGSMPGTSWNGPAPAKPPPGSPRGRWLVASSMSLGWRSAAMWSRSVESGRPLRPCRFR